MNDLENTIELSNISVDIGNRHILKGVSFNVTKNCIHGFLGPNGAGKSTTMRVLTGVLGSKSGVVKILGKTMTPSNYELKDKIGYLPENPPLYEDMIVSDYLSFMAELRGHKDKDYLHHIMEQLQIIDVSKRIIGNLSRGFKQRVGIAQALIHQPEIVILDEPTLGLDPHAIVEMRDLIQSLSADKTILLSSHQLGEVEKICDEVTLIKDGKILASGDMEQLKQQARDKDEKVKVKVSAYQASFEKILSLKKLNYIFYVHSVSEDSQGIAQLNIEMNNDPEFRAQLVSDLLRFGLAPIEIEYSNSLENYFLKELSL